MFLAFFGPFSCSVFFAVKNAGVANQRLVSSWLDPLGWILTKQTHAAKCKDHRKAQSPEPPLTVPNDSLLPRRSALGGPSAPQNSFRCFPRSSSPLGGARGNRVTRRPVSQIGYRVFLLNPPVRNIIRQIKRITPTALPPMTGPPR